MTVQLDKNSGGEGFVLSAIGEIEAVSTGELFRETQQMAGFACDYSLLQM
jgi:hypothetical protein